MDDLNLPAVHQIEDELLLAFVIDVAQNIYPYELIAERYGFASGAVMFEFIKNNEAIRKQIGRHRAAFGSDQGVQDRVRLKAGLGAEELVPYVTLRCKHPDTPFGQVLAGAEWLSKTAGTYGQPAAARPGETGTGTKFNLAIIFSNGETTKITADLPVGQISDGSHLPPA